MDKHPSILDPVLSLLDKGCASDKKPIRVMSKTTIFLVLVGMLLYSLISLAKPKNEESNNG